MSGSHKMGHVQPFQNYLFTLAALLILTAVTVIVSRITPSLFVAMTVAFLKASLVVLFFMHGKYEGKATWAFIYYPFVLLAILLGAVFLDYSFGKDRTNPDNYLAKPLSLKDPLNPFYKDHGDAGHASQGHKPAAAEHGATAEHEAAAEHGATTEETTGQHGEATEAPAEGATTENPPEGDNANNEGNH